MVTVEIISMVKTNLLLAIVTIKGGLSISNRIIVKPVAVVIKTVPSMTDSFLDMNTIGVIVVK